MEEFEENDENKIRYIPSYDINVSDGYGDMMENSYSELTYRMNVDDIEKLRNEDIKINLKQNFNNSITKYKDPLTYNSFASTPELSIVEKKSNGFTTKVGNTFLCDYTEAFSHNDSLNFTLETVNINKDTLNNTDLTSAYEKLLAERNEFERHSRMTHLDMVDQNKNIQITFDNIGSNRK